MTYFELSAIVNAAVSIFLAVVVITNEKKQTNRSFVYFALSVALWSIGYFLWQIADSQTDALLWIRFFMVGAILIPFTYLHFIFSFLNLFAQRKIWIYTGYAVAMFFEVMIFNDLLIAGTKDVVYFHFWPKPGPLFHYFLIIWIGVVIYTTFILFQEYRKSSGVVHVRNRYLLSGVVIGFIGGITNYFLWYDIPIPPYGNILVVAYVIAITIAILKYNFLNIKIILAEVLVFCLWVLITVELFLAETFKEIIIESFILIFVIILGIFLIKSVSGEVSRREETEKLVSELREVNEKLRELDQIKSDFISIASHQLRTPLTAIKGYTSMLLEGVYGDVPIKARGVIDKIFQSSQRLVYIVNDMLDVTRIEGGRLKYDFEDVRLMNVVNDVVEELKQNALRKKLKFNFHIDVDDADIMVYADSNKIRQAITNLIDNSIKYTNAGFVLVFVSRSGDGKGALITIKDSGLGMTKDTLSIIFNKFFRAKGALKSHTEGSGLGLYVAREIIRAHSGDVWADSEGPGRGSQFYIQLPIKKG